MKETRPSRVIIDRVIPEIDGGRFAAKRYIDHEVQITAMILCDGHDTAKGRLLFRHESDNAFQVLPLKAKGNDEWVASFKPDKLGRYYFTVEAAIDRFGTWSSDLLKRIAAGQNIDVDIQIGTLLMESWLSHLNSSQKSFLQGKIMQLKKMMGQTNLVLNDVMSCLKDPALERLAHSVFDEGSFVRYDKEVPIQVEPVLARFSAWYEFFPRSTVSSPLRHGQFKDAEKRLDYIADLGFNVVYLPPIHPIGMAYRKGKNNALQAEASDVGSPWAIGGKAGGHKDILPELGTFKDFESFIKKARDLGIEVAMDIAFQCSPDHPYVKDHPQWFKKRPDGTIQYAENPPKKYQDIYPFDFETEDWRALWVELRDVVQFWISKGVKVFRVDNPHTKPFHFWEWLISTVRAQSPEVIFLAEAFTRPKVMAYLAKSGFSQSYTYFTWRNVKWELTQYMTELTQTELIDYFAPNFWPNTPDILPEALQTPNKVAYTNRFILAATLSSNYGIYGPAYELMVSTPKTKGGEEYLDSEKYELKSWDLNQPHNLAPLIKKVNSIRKKYPCLQQNRGFKILPINNESLFAFAKCDENEKIVVVVNLDHQGTQSGLVELPLIDWHIPENEDFEVRDLLTDTSYFWRGWRNFVELRPDQSAHIFQVIVPSKAKTGTRGAP